MPGVPTGRGCDSCRKQKKKCDIENYPCSRCRRLDLPCIGHGQRRYKFKNETVDPTPPGRPVSKSLAKSLPHTVVAEPTRNLTNAISSLTSAFIHSISQDVDIKFQLPWNFGGFLHLVPTRLGRSAALDAAIDTLVAAHAQYCVGGLAPNRLVLTKYARALSVLRHDLDDAAKARSSESLCAVLVLSIAQLFVEPNRHDAITHTGGAAQIIRNRGFRNNSPDPFERSLILTIRGPVVFEALLTDKIQFSSREWKIFNAKADSTFLSGGEWYYCIAEIPDLIQRSKAALILYDPPSLHLLTLELETRSLLEDIKATIATQRVRLENYDPNSQPPELSGHMHAHHLRTLGMALATGIILNCILGGLEGTTNWVSQESSSWSEEIAHLSRIATKYQPLGSMAMILCLRLALLGAVLPSTKLEIEALLLDYETACMGCPASGVCADMMRTMRRFTLQDL